MMNAEALCRERIDCPLRHAENGNCSLIGGFCTSVSSEICEALQNAYKKGYSDGVIEVQTRLGVHRNDV